MKEQQPSGMARALKWIGVVLAMPVVLFVVLTVLLYIPFVQDFAVKQVVGYVEGETGYKVELERLRISFPLDIDLQGLVVTDAVGDTLVATKSLVVDLDMARILSMHVGVDAVDLHSAQVNSKDMIATIQVSGRLEQFYVKANDVDLDKQQVHVNDVRLSNADVAVAMRDTVVAEEESEPSKWVIDIDRVSLDGVRARFASAGDSILLATSIATFEANDGHIDLGHGVYDIGKTSVEADTLHIAMLDADSSVMAVPVPRFNMEWGSMSFSQDPMTIGLDGFAFNTDKSHLKGNAYVNLAKLNLNAGDAVKLDLQADLSIDEMIASLSRESRYFSLSRVSSTLSSLPSHQLAANVSLSGNLRQMVLRQFDVSLPGSFALTASGDLHDFIKARTRNAQLNYSLTVTDLDWLRPLASGALDGIGLPPMQLQGRAGIEGHAYSVDAELQQDDGVVTLSAEYKDTSMPSYNASLNIRQLNIQHFLTDMPLGLLTASAEAEGTGLDFLSPATRMNGSVDVKHIQYDKWSLGNLTLVAKAANGRGVARLSSDNELLTADIDLAARLSRPMADLTFGIDLSSIDLHGLGLVDEPLSTSMCMQLTGSTNLDNAHHLAGSLSDIVLYTPDSIFHPEDASIDLLLRRDTTHVDLKSGDLVLRLDGGASYDVLLTQLQHFTAEIDKQLTDRHVDMNRLRQRLPQVALHLQSGQHNPAHDILARHGLAINDVQLSLTMNPWDGMNGGGHVYTLSTGAMVLDTITLALEQNENGINLDSRLHNGRSNPHVSFDATLTAFLRDKGAGAHLIYTDDYGRKGVDLGLLTRMEADGFRMKLYPFEQVIAYRTFHINDSNYVFLGRNDRIDADIDLLADDGTGLKLYSTPGSDALQDLSVFVNHLNLGELTSVIPYFPRITGFLNGDAHLIQTEDNMSVSADLTAQQLTYENAQIGELGMQAVYLPNADGSHFVDGHMLHEGKEVASFSGTYTSGDIAGKLDMDAMLDHLPLSLANGFIPDGMIRLDGSLLGDVHIGGTTSRPAVNGQLSIDDMRMLSDLYSLNLRFENDTIAVNNSNLHFDKIHVYSSGKEPFVLDGNVNFADFDNIALNLSMLAKDYELINAKKTARSVAYGKMLVDCNASLRGTLNNLRFFGRLNVKAGTDLTYVLDDSPLTVEDQLAELVEFVDFNDTLRLNEKVSEKPQNLNMFLNIVIDDAAQARCLLSSDGSSYVNVEGGGTLNMTYTPEKDMQMTGRYTINKGTLKYTMMVIPLKEFTIKSGSYVEFRGPIMNPYLSLSATERLRTTITENEHPRSVNFDVGMNISQTLERMGLEFTLDAPEDMSIQNELAQMSTEQRGRVAVTMLATGMYITDNGTSSSGGFSTQNALNSFLQSQISNIAGKALKSVDISMGVEQGTSSTGTTTTDYSFSFAKRFWGNRISIIIGGKVSTGEDAQNTGQTLIDNVSIEYRLDKGATRYVNLFYDKNYESVLDGEIIEMGAGLVLRRKTNKLGELFLFRKKEE